MNLDNTNMSENELAETLSNLGDGCNVQLKNVTIYSAEGEYFDIGFMSDGSYFDLSKRKSYKQSLVNACMQARRRLQRMLKQCECNS